MDRRPLLAVALLPLGLAAASTAAEPTARRYTEEREPCRDHDPGRNAYFGDLHVHSGYSMDAYVYGTLADPDAAYRFARGEEIPLAGGRTARLERPLDFMAVTDHGEYLGEVSLCTRPGSAPYDSEACAIFRGEAPPPEGGQRMSVLAPGAVDSRDPDSLDVATPQRSTVICGDDRRACPEAARTPWEEIQAAAERAYDRSAECRFTSFHAYEYSLTPDYSKIHRNVVFRNANVIDLPVTWLDQDEPEGLWRELDAQCLKAGTGCDVLAIPHNPNLSNGRMFQVEYRGAPLEEQVEIASLRARMEPLVEIMQVKSDSECRSGLYQVAGDADELCRFEKARPAEVEDCGEGTGKGGLLRRGCVSRLDFVRYALIEGLREAERIGVNPYRLGIIASTDTHNATGGDTEERSFQGAHADSESTPAGRLAKPRNNPGGLVGVWAEENSRDALFDAMRRRETFGTSGSRIQPRFFGGWNYPADVCSKPGLVERGDEGGVPMGGELPAAPAGAEAPSFVAAALRDPGGPSVTAQGLQRIQIVKGFVGDDGRFQQRVYDVAGSPTTGAELDAASCEPTGLGEDSLCAVWRDPDFDPGRHAVYYARVLETPSCRWSALQCSALPEDERPASCADPEIPRVIQERAWTSPIWYAPR